MILRKISRSELETIHEKTLYLYEHVGVDFEHPELLELFKKKGSGFRETGYSFPKKMWMRQSPHSSLVLL